MPEVGRDPLGYLGFLRQVVADRRIDVVLPTHEQAWLFAAAGGLLSGVSVVVAEVASFARVQSKVEFARLIDELGLRQRPWRLIAGPSALAGLTFSYWLKTSFSTTGRGVRLVSDERSRDPGRRPGTCSIRSVGL